jgi:hypothetical protein
MSTVRLRNPETRLSVALQATAAAVQGRAVTLRELLALVGEQGLLVFCALLATPFLLPVSLPFMSTALGLPMLLIGVAVTLNRVPWLPERLLDRTLPAAAVQQTLRRVARWALRIEHLFRPRLPGLSEGPAINVLNGGLLALAALLLMAPLPFVPFGNTLPGVAIILLCLGMAERDGVLILLGYGSTLLATAYIGALTGLVIYAGLHVNDALELLRNLWQQVRGG